MWLLLTGDVSFSFFLSFSRSRKRLLTQKKKLNLVFPKKKKKKKKKKKLFLQIPTKAQAAALSAELEARSALPPQVAAALDALPADSTHPMTQLAVGTLAMQSGSKFAQAYAEGLHKSRYWEPVLEDSLDLIARLPALAARIYRRTYHGGKYIEAKVKNEKRRVFFFFQVFVFFSFPATSFLKNLFFSLSLSLFPLQSHHHPPPPTNQLSPSRASTGPETSPT